MQQGNPTSQEVVVAEVEVVQHRSYQALEAAEGCLQGSQAGPEEAAEEVEGVLLKSWALHLRLQTYQHLVLKLPRRLLLRRRTA